MLALVLLRGLQLAAAATLATLCLAPAAVAGTVRADDGRVVFEAVAGESNAVTLAPGGLSDASAPIVAGPGCAATADPHRVDCGPLQHVTVRLGDRDDTFRGAAIAAPTFATVDAGPGDDVLIGGVGPEEMNGGAGRDSIDGGGGADVLTDGPDLVVEAGERRTVPADDHVSGGPGDDTIFGRHGRDRLSGGAGNDALTASEGSALNRTPIVPLAQDDSADCGAGTDTFRGDYADGYGASCEFADEGTPMWRAIRTRGRRRIVVKARCAWLSSRPCRGRVALRRARAARPVNLATSIFAPGVAPPRRCPASRRAGLLAATRFDLRAGRVGRVSLPITRRLRAALRERRCVAAVVRFGFRDARRRYTSTRSLTLRR